jgi:hypothetical protein
MSRTYNESPVRAYRSSQTGRTYYGQDPRFNYTETSQQFIERNNNPFLIGNPQLQAGAQAANQGIQNARLEQQKAGEVLLNAQGQAIGRQEGLNETAFKTFIADINKTVSQQADSLAKFATDTAKLVEALNNFPRALPIGEVQHKQAGGLIRGTDTVPAMLTPGEYVMPVDKTNKYRHTLDKMRRGYYQQGGLVDPQNIIEDIFNKAQRNPKSILNAANKAEKFLPDKDESGLREAVEAMAYHANQLKPNDITLGTPGEAFKTFANAQKNAPYETRLSKDTGIIGKIDRGLTRAFNTSGFTEDAERIQRLRETFVGRSEEHTSELQSLS